MKEKAKTLMCPFQQSETTTILCITSSCMAWEDDGHYLMPEDKTVKIYVGHCKLIDKEALCEKQS